MSNEVTGGVSGRVVLRRLSFLLRSFRSRLPFLLALVGVPALVVVSYSIPLGQINLVEARTLGAQITTAGPDTVWKLPTSTLCQNLGPSKDLRKAASWTERGCNPGLYETSKIEQAEIRIPAGVRLSLKSEPGGSILLRRLPEAENLTTIPPSIIRLNATHQWEPGSLLRIDAEAWKEVALLEFAGNVAIGQEAGSGADAYLIEGRYEVRERFLHQYRPWGNSDADPTPVISGTLYRGDEVTFSRRDIDSHASETVLVTGFIAPVFEQDARGFGIVVSSGFGQSQPRFSVKSYGTREAHIKPTWVARALRDPVLLAMTAILGFAVTALTFIIEVGKLASKKKKPQRENSSEPAK